MEKNTETNKYFIIGIISLVVIVISINILVIFFS